LRYKEQIVVMKHHREIEQIRSRISRDIHDEIGAGLTKVKLMTRKLFKPGGSEVKPEVAKKITETADELIRNLGEIVWTINPENDSLENMVAFIRIYLSRLADETSECTLDFVMPSPESVPDRVVNPQIKRNVLLILKEALNNAMKHAQASAMNVSLAITDNKIHITVSDNGIGFGDEAFRSSGNGLKNMKKRAEAIGGELLFHSDSSGTTVALNVPLDSAGNLL
jgi:signal transduction histidine kinase